jgi:membrane-bound serine protease (ClpP class)
MAGEQPNIPGRHHSGNSISLAILVISVGLGTSLAASTPATTASSAPIGRHIENGKIITPDGWFPLPEVQRPNLPPPVSKAVVIPIHGPIGGTMADAVQRKIVQANGAGAQLVIFDMDTPGGEMSAMMRIVQLIEQDMAGTFTIAFVNPRAYSAGAIISLACNEIDMTPPAIIGDAMPVQLGPTGYVPIAAEERAKIESAMRGEVRSLAERNGYSPALCEGLITMNLEIWLIRHRRTGELQYVNADQWHDKVRSAPTSGPATPSGDVDWEFVRQIKSPRELLTMTSSEAMRLGMAQHIFADQADLARYFHVSGAIEEFADTWSEQLSAFLSSAWAMGVLLFVGLICVYVEAHTPGFGVAGTVAVIAFALLFGSRYLAGLAQWWEIALFGIGVILILVELFVLPGHGVSGIIGGALCILAIVAMLIPNRPGKLPWPETALDWQFFTHGMLAFGSAVLASVVAMLVLARHLPRLPIAGRLFLAPPRIATTPPAPESSPIFAVRAGMTGTVHQICRPVGKVIVEGKLLDAVSEGEYLPAGTRVVVLRNEGNRVVVAERADRIS